MSDFRSPRQQPLLAPCHRDLNASCFPTAWASLSPAWPWPAGFLTTLPLSYAPKICPPVSHASHTILSRLLHGFTRCTHVSFRAHLREGPLAATPLPRRSQEMRLCGFRGTAAAGWAWRAGGGHAWSHAGKAAGSWGLPLAAFDPLRSPVFPGRWNSRGVDEGGEQHRYPYIRARLGDSTPRTDPPHLGRDVELGGSHSDAELSNGKSPKQGRGSRKQWGQAAKAANLRGTSSSKSPSPGQMPYETGSGRTPQKISGSEPGRPHRAQDAMRQEGQALHGCSFSEKWGTR